VQEAKRLPWQRVLWSLCGALLIAVVGCVALLADEHDPGPLHIAAEIIALPFVRLFYWASGRRVGSAIVLPVASSVLVWWVILFVLLTMRARTRNAPRSA
jgi:hypothetical protein